MLAQGKFARPYFKNKIQKIKTTNKIQTKGWEHGSSGTVLVYHEVLGSIPERKESAIKGTNMI
jgi:hypothetical protein